MQIETRSRNLRKSVVLLHNRGVARAKWYRSSGPCLEMVLLTVLSPGCPDVEVVEMQTRQAESPMQTRHVP